MIPVVRTNVYCRKLGPGITGFGSREIIGLVVLSPGGASAFKASGEGIPVEHYVKQVPELVGILESYPASS